MFVQEQAASIRLTSTLKKIRPYSLSDESYCLKRLLRIFFTQHATFVCSGTRFFYILFFALTIYTPRPRPFAIYDHLKSCQEFSEFSSLVSFYSSITEHSVSLRVILLVYRRLLSFWSCHVVSYRSIVS